MAPAKVTIPEHVAGDTWKGFTFGPVTPTPAYPVASATLTFRNVDHPGTSAAYILGTPSTGSKGVMTISNANTYLIEVPRQSLPLKPGDYVGRLQTVDSQGTKVSYLDIVVTIR